MFTLIIILHNIESPSFGSQKYVSSFKGRSNIFANEIIMYTEKS